MKKENDKLVTVLVDGEEKETIEVPLYGKIEIEIQDNKVVFITASSKKKIK